MSVKIFDNTPRVKANVDHKIPLALRLIVDAIDSESIPRTPMQHGDLRRAKHKQVLGNHGRISWLQHYAIFQEAKQFSNYTTPGTGPHFAENAVRKVVHNSSKYFRQAGL